ncbi:MAG: helicase C-terminal domain-containing protein, partial [Candidatus Hodarchaeota archaeon]
ELRFSSAHENHTPQTYQLYADAILQLHALNPDHTLVACASHDMKEQLRPFLQTPYVEDPHQVVPPWLPDLSSRSNQLILTAMGGRLTEGLEILDLVTGRSKITLTVIAGLPFPVRDIQQNYLMYLYTRRYSAFLAEKFLIYLPTLTKLLQTLGRGIRSPSDYSAAVVLDYRATQFFLGSHQRFYREFDILMLELFRFYRRQR